MPFWNATAAILNVFILLANDNNHINDLIQSAIVEEPGALRILVLTADRSRPGNNVRTYECHEDTAKSCILPQDFCVDVVIELAENAGLPQSVNYALDYMEETFQFLGSRPRETKIVLATIPFLIACPFSPQGGDFKCERSIFWSGEFKEANAPAMTVVPLSHGAKNILNTFSTPLVLLNDGVIRSGFRFDVSYVSIGGFMAMGLELLLQNNAIERANSRFTIPILWTSLTSERAIKNIFELYNNKQQIWYSKADSENSNRFLRDMNFNAQKETPTNHKADQARRHDIDLFYIEAESILKSPLLLGRDYSNVLAKIQTAFSPIQDAGLGGQHFWGVNPTHEQIHIDREKIKVGAIVCLHNENTFLNAILENLSGNVDKIVVLVGTSPWNGRTVGTGADTTISMVQKFIDRKNWCGLELGKAKSGKEPGLLRKIKLCIGAHSIDLVTGQWQSEGEQRTFGVKRLRGYGDYYFALMVDADEFWSPVDLRKVVKIASQNREVHSYFRVAMWTYWKFLRVRIDPPEELRALALVSIAGPCYCTTFFIREPIDCSCWGDHKSFIHYNISMMHHLSYVRTTPEVERKISSFEHNGEIRRTWYEKIWRRWDDGNNYKDLHNLHPTLPKAFQSSVAQPILELVPALRHLYIATCHTGGHLYPLGTSIGVHRMLCYSPFDDRLSRGRLVHRRTPHSFACRRLDKKLSCLDFLLLVIPGGIDVSTKLVFPEIALNIQHGLVNLGYRVSTRVCKSLLDCPWKQEAILSQEQGTCFPTRIIVVGSVGVTSYSYSSTSKPIILEKADTYLAKNSILYQFEHLDDTEWINGHAAEVYKSKKFVLWDYHFGNQKVYDQLGMLPGTAKHVPYGFTRSLIFPMQEMRVKADPNNRLPDEIDVLYFGKPNEHRQHFINALNSRGVNVYADHMLFGERRDMAVARSKIVLNLRYWGKPKTIESKMSRIVYLLANKAFVVSDYYAVSDKDRETLQGGVVFVENYAEAEENFLSDFYEHFADVVYTYLHDVPRSARLKIAMRGHLMIQLMPMMQFLKGPAASTRDFVECAAINSHNISHRKLCEGEKCKLMSMNVQVQHEVGNSTWHLLTYMYGDNPVHTLLPKLAAIPNMTAVSTRMVMKEMQNLALRSVQKVAKVITVLIFNKTNPTQKPRAYNISLHYGEDIDLLAEVFATNMGGVDQMVLARHMKNELRNADESIEWIGIRECNDELSTFSGVHYGCSRNRRMLAINSTREEKVTVVFTTCKRLEKFLLTAKSLYASLQKQGVLHLIENFVVIDDGSSAHDVSQMKRVFPNFLFLLKDESAKGHAESLNMVLNGENSVFAATEARYVLYFEDDWLVDAGNSDPWFLNSLTLLKHSTEPNVAQVLLDNRHGGWPRVYNRRIPYRYHEFGIHTLSSVDHPLPNWPGFSNNPGFWDLDQMRLANLKFEIHSPTFEQHFSLDFYDAGLRVICLQLDLTTHIGNDVSSYALNGRNNRYWDL